ncbi:hypothetical protein ACFC5Z_09450 [Streptomyces sp. NPDC056004]|uniref:hypothetical protein n=1 Tax=Streptomyces sp. NPDC056004 TaxID=3345677 RepID=UPI0035E37589
MDCARHRAPAEYRADEGCLTLLIRIPVRIVVLVVVLPVRMAWDALAVAARAAYRDPAAPLGRALVRLYEPVLVPLGAWLAWHLVGAPVDWAYRTVCTPLGHFVRDRIRAPAGRAAAEAGRAARSALRSAGETVRQARRDAWRALVGGARGPEPRELGRRVTRTLGSATTVPSAAPEPEISSPGEKNAERG